MIRNAMARALRPALWATGALLALAAAPAQAARVDAPALPIERLVTIQPIQVCQGGACAATTFLPQYLTAANVILNQAGIGVAAAPLVQFNAPPVGAGQPNYLNLNATTGLFDDIRRLVRENGRGATPATLNVFFVNTITQGTTPAYGWGLIGGNGAVVATGVRRVEVSPGVFQNRTAAVDTLAHELAHNLGLGHPEEARTQPGNLRWPRFDTDGRPLNDPRNLMVSSNRAALTDFCQVPPYTCATGNAANDQRAALTARQIGTGAPGETGTLRNPLVLTQLPKVGTDSFAIGTGGTGLISTSTTLLETIPPGLRAMEFRFRQVVNEPLTVFFTTRGGGGVITPTITSTPAPGGAVNRVISVPLGAGITVAGAPVSGNWQVPSGTLLPPHSTQYSFGNGLASRAGFDAGGEALSSQGAEFSFDPVAGALPGPSLLPQDLFDAQGDPLVSPLTGLPVEVVIDPSFNTVEEMGRFALPFAGFELPPAMPPYNPPPAPPIGVPGPPALGLFALGLAGLAAARRRAARAV